MTLGDMGSVRPMKSMRWIAAAVMVALTAAGCSGEPETPDDVATSPTGAAPTSEVSESPTDSVLPDECEALADPPEDGDVIVYDEYVRYSPEYIDEKYSAPVSFSATLQNTSELVAIDIEADYRFYIDGEDVTVELMPDIESFRPVELDRLTWNTPGTDREVIFPLGDQLDGPSYWEDADVELKVTVTVGGWCTPAEWVLP